MAGWQGAGWLPPRTCKSGSLDSRLAGGRTPVFPAPPPLHPAWPQPEPASRGRSRTRRAEEAGATADSKKISRVESLKNLILHGVAAREPELPPEMFALQSCSCRHPGHGHHPARLANRRSKSSERPPALLGFPAQATFSPHETFRYCTDRQWLVLHLTKGRLWMSKNQYYDDDRTQARITSHDQSFEQLSLRPA